MHFYEVGFKKPVNRVVDDDGKKVTNDAGDMSSMWVEFLP